MRLHRSMSSGCSKCISGKAFVGDFSPSSLSAAHVSLRMSRRVNTELTKVGEALELVQAALHEARGKTCCRWSHRGKCLERGLEDVWKVAWAGGRINCSYKLRRGSVTFRRGGLPWRLAPSVAILNFGAQMTATTSPIHQCIANDTHIA
jgi:hypothetical protein